ncbi:hypothetical protein GQ55_1G332800 [Panicum hallii var. hallii]|uniref:Uncharacterized protein n=1 Tax=Panicum hallii var. hallii TaxID=1504633 RepID=A0A2T7FA63_9POAL|nr:hypothetical protein GQ55_1G332800 [Panicum hallii var. hallii]
MPNQPQAMSARMKSGMYSPRTPRRGFAIPAWRTAADGRRRCEPRPGVSENTWGLK